MITRRNGACLPSMTEFQDGERPEFGVVELPELIDFGDKPTVGAGHRLAVPPEESNDGEQDDTLY